MEDAAPQELFRKKARADSALLHPDARVMLEEMGGYITAELHMSEDFTKVIAEALPDDIHETEGPGSGRQKMEQVTRFPVRQKDRKMFFLAK